MMAMTTDTAPCDLCETDRNIKWRCVQCQFYMCEKCEKIHSKVQTSSIHEIIDVIPLCSECITDTHHEHNDDLTEKAEGTETLKQLDAKISQELMFFKSEQNELQNTEISWDFTCSQSIEEINRREVLLKDAVQKYAQVLRNAIINEQETMKKTISKKRIEIEEIIHDLEQEQGKVQAAIQSAQGQSITMTASRLEERCSNLSFKSLPSVVTGFIPANFLAKEETLFNVQNINNLFGYLGPVEMVKLQSNFDLEVVKSYKTNLASITSIVTINDKAAWVSDTSDEILHKIILGEDKDTLKEISTEIPVYDIATDSNGGILLSVLNSSDIEIIDESGDLISYVSVSPMFPLGIHVTKDGDILAGVKDGGDDFILTNESCRQVLLLDFNGTLKQSYEFDENEQQLLTFPHRITTNVNNNDIIVLDKICEPEDSDKYNGRVLVLGKQGVTKWVYHGHPTINWEAENTPFHPVAVVTTSIGHIIVADETANALHILSSKGDLLTCKNKGIISPSSLAIDSRGQLWVGTKKCLLCSDFKMKDVETDAEIHVLKISC